MKTVVVSIRDVKGETYAQPWFTHTAAVAVRHFTDIVNNPEKGGTIYSHPEDFQLYEIGIWDDIDGKIYSHDIPKHLVSAASVKKEKLHDSIAAV